MKSDNTDITGPESLNGGKKLCSVTGSTPAQKVKDQYAKDVQLQEFDTYSACVEALRNGAVDAVTTDDIILAGYAAQYPGELKVVARRSPRSATASAWPRVTTRPGPRSTTPSRR